MKDIVIISIYDSCYGWSILIDGHIISREELEYPMHRFPKGMRKIAKEVYEDCNDCYDYCGIHLYQYLLEKFNSYKTIIVCEDGEIKILKGKEEDKK